MNGGEVIFLDGRFWLGPGHEVPHLNEERLWEMAEKVDQVPTTDVNEFDR